MFSVVSEEQIARVETRRFWNSDSVKFIRVGVWVAVIAGICLGQVGVNGPARARRRSCTAGQVSVVGVTCGGDG